jgi:hypothetical protein
MADLERCVELQQEVMAEIIKFRTEINYFKTVIVEFNGKVKDLDNEMDHVRAHEITLSTIAEKLVKDSDAWNMRASQDFLAVSSLLSDWRKDFQGQSSLISDLIFKIEKLEEKLVGHINDSKTNK